MMAEGMNPRGYRLSIRIHAAGDLAPEAYRVPARDFVRFNTLFCVMIQIIQLYFNNRLQI